MKHLLEQLLGYIQVEEEHQGLCISVKKMYKDHQIAQRGYEMLLEYIKNNRPKATWFARNFQGVLPLYGKHHIDPCLYYWKQGVIKYRIRWLKKHIKLCKT